MELLPGQLLIQVMILLLDVYHIHDHLGHVEGIQDHLRHISHLVDHDEYIGHRFFLRHRNIDPLLDDIRQGVESKCSFRLQK